jgi:hypothetical protein
VVNALDRKLNKIYAAAEPVVTVLLPKEVTLPSPAPPGSPGLPGSDNDLPPANSDIDDDGELEDTPPQPLPEVRPAFQATRDLVLKQLKNQSYMRLEGMSFQEGTQKMFLENDSKKMQSYLKTSDLNVLEGRFMSSASLAITDVPYGPSSKSSKSTVQNFSKLSQKAIKSLRTSADFFIREGGFFIVILSPGLLPEYMKEFSEEKEYEKNVHCGTVESALAGMKTRWDVMQPTMNLMASGRGYGNRPAFLSQDFELGLVMRRCFWDPQKEEGEVGDPRPLHNPLAYPYLTEPLTADELLQQKAKLAGKKAPKKPEWPDFHPSQSMNNFFDERKEEWVKGGFSDMVRFTSSNGVGTKRLMQSATIVYNALKPEQRLKELDPASTKAKRLRNCAEKARVMLVELLLMYSKPNDLVVDFCAGTFSLGLACAMAGRR